MYMYLLEVYSLEGNQVVVDRRLFSTMQAAKSGWNVGTMTNKYDTLTQDYEIHEIQTED